MISSNRDDENWDDWNVGIREAMENGMFLRLGRSRGF
jgi:hypothetical protein